MLRRAGLYVDLFEKEKGVGGRVASTRMGGVTFDHGAQYITARGPAFRAYLHELKATGYASIWEPKIAVAGEGGATGMLSWYVGIPGMTSIVRPMAESVQVFTGRTVHTIERRNKAWHIWFDDETSAGPYAAVAIGLFALYQTTGEEHHVQPSEDRHPTHDRRAPSGRS